MRHQRLGAENEEDLLKWQQAFSSSSEQPAANVVRVSKSPVVQRDAHLTPPSPPSGGGKQESDSKSPDGGRPYAGLEVMGELRERGYTCNEPPSTSYTLPSPSVVPFPQARHRFHGRSPAAAKGRNTRRGGTIVPTGALDVDDVDDPNDDISASPATAARRGAGMSSEAHSIHAENLSAISAMSAQEIAEAQADLARRLDPRALEMLRRRGASRAKAASAGSSSHDDAAAPAPAPAPATAPVSAHSATPAAGELAQAGARTGVAHAVQAAQVQHQQQRPGDDSGEDERPRAGPEGAVPAPPAAAAAAAGGPGLGAGEKATAAARLSWTERVEGVRRMRFDLSGAPLPPDVSAAADAALGLPPSSPGGGGEESASEGATRRLGVRHVAERDVLRSEGNPGGGGYSVREASALARSHVPAQRAAALHVLASILGGAAAALAAAPAAPAAPAVAADVDARAECDWEAVWAYCLGPEAQLPLTVRIGMDDSNDNVVLAATRALYALFTCAPNGALFRRQMGVWRGEYTQSAGPVFRPRPAASDAFLGAARWKTNVKAAHVLPAGGGEGEEEEQRGNAEEGPQATVGTDEDAASRDVAAGLLRMGILPRLRFILEVLQLRAADELLLDVLAAFARHSATAAEAVMACPRLLAAVQLRFLHPQAQRQEEGATTTTSSSSSSTAAAIRLLTALCQASREHAVAIARSDPFRLAMAPLLCHPRSTSLLLLPPSSSFSSKGASAGGVAAAAAADEGQHAAWVEALRLWRVCARYSCPTPVTFSDLYAGLCHSFTCPPEQQQQQQQRWEEAQEAYLLLEALAATLPRLHLAHPAGGRSQRPAAAAGLLDWSCVLPVIDEALTWLSPGSPSLIRAPPQGGAGAAVGALAAVVHFLATVVSRVTPPSASASTSASASAATSTSAAVSAPASPAPGPSSSSSPAVGRPELLPPFVRDVGRALLASGLLAAAPIRQLLPLDDGNSNGNGHAPLAEVAVSCVRGLLRLVHALDAALAYAQLDALCLHPPPPPPTGAPLPQEDENTEEAPSQAPPLAPAPASGSGSGGLESSAGEGPLMLQLRGSLAGGAASKALNFVLEEAGGHVQRAADTLWRCQVHGRSGPAPGLALGWGSKGGGLWSCHVALLRSEACLVFNIISLVVPPSVQSEQAAGLEGGGEQSTATWQRVAEIGLAALSLAGPSERQVASQSLHIVLLHTALASCCGADSASDETSVSARVAAAKFVSTVLAGHYRATWFGAKQRKSREGENSSVAESAARSRQLAPVLEDAGEGGEQEEQEQQEQEQEQEQEPQELMSEWHTQRLPLPPWWLLSALGAHRGGDTWHAPAAHAHAVLYSALLLLRGLEVSGKDHDHPGACHVAAVGRISLLRKIHSLSQAFLGEARLYLAEDIRPLLAGLQSAYSDELAESDRWRMAEQRGQERDSAQAAGAGAGGETVGLLEEEISPMYVAYAEELVSHFTADSFGDPLYARQVAMLLRQEAGLAVREATWHGLLDTRTLALLPPAELCWGLPAAYLQSCQEDEKMLQRYLDAWASGALEAAAARDALPFTLALHHIAAHLFALPRLEGKAVRAAKTLVRSLAARRSLEVTFVRLLKYKSREAGGMLPGSDEVKDAHAVQERLAALQAACAGDPQLLCALSKLQLDHRHRTPLPCE